SCTLLSCVSYSAEHRDLHSFPTRRSSDLVGIRNLVHGQPQADVDAQIAPRLLTQVEVGEFADGMPGVNVRTIERYRVFEYVCKYIADLCSTVVVKVVIPVEAVLG